MKAKLLTIQPTHQEEWDTFWEEMVTTGQKKKKVCMDQFKCACLICKWGWEILFKKRKGLWRNPRHLEARIVRPLYVAFQRSLHSPLCFFCRIRSISNKVKLQMSEGVVWKG